MTDKHTPGPWFVNQRKHVIEIDNGLESPDYRHITNALPWQDGGPTDGHGVSLQVKANAHLIAASPRMADYIAMRASLGDNEAKQILKELGYAESETPDQPIGGHVGPSEQDAS